MQPLVHEKVYSKDLAGRRLYRYMAGKRVPSPVVTTTWSGSTSSVMRSERPPKQS